MDTQKIINRVVGTEGILRIPSWWMHKILSDLVKYCEENKGASVTIKKLIDELTTEVDKKLESEVVIVAESTESFGFEYDDTELRRRITKLEAQVKELMEKQDTSAVLGKAILGYAVLS